MKNLKTSPFHTAFIISTAFLFGYVLLASTGYMLSIEPGLAIGGISRWCERIVDGIFREPANALSNLGFMVSGLIMFKVLSEERPRENQKFYGINKTSGIFAAAVIYLGPGSMLMHGTHTEWGQWADNLSMVMFIVFPWIYNLKCMGGWSENRFVTIYILVVATYGITRGVFGDGLGIVWIFLVCRSDYGLYLSVYISFGHPPSGCSQALWDLLLLLFLEFCQQKLCKSQPHTGGPFFFGCLRFSQNKNQTQ